MPLLKRTYALPADMLQRFEKNVASGRRSRLIAAVLREWLERRERERLRLDIAEGCREMKDVYLDIERGYHPLEEEVHRALDANPPAGRRRARPTRSR